MSAELELPGVAENEAASAVVGQLEPAHQRRLVALILELREHAQPARPHAVGGKAMHVRVFSAGKVGWWGDGKSYRYLPRQPAPRGIVGAPWPPMPREFVELWRRITGRDDEPDTALITALDARDPEASIGWHAERTEHDLGFPIVITNLGRARWAVRQKEGAPVSRCTLEPGAVVLLDGPTRLLEHSLERLVDYDDQLELGMAPPRPPPFAPYPSPLPGGGKGRWSIELRIAGDPKAVPAELEERVAGSRVVRPAESTVSWEEIARAAEQFRRGTRTA